MWSAVPAAMADVGGATWWSPTRLEPAAGAEAAEAVATMLAVAEFLATAAITPLDVGAAVLGFRSPQPERGKR